MKGMAFSLIIMIALVPIMSIILLDLTQVTNRRELISSIRVNELEGLYGSIESDYQKFVQVSMPRAISSAINYDINNGKGLDDASTRLEELVTNGSLFGVEEGLMENATFPFWANKINTIATTKDFTTNITVSDITVKPNDAWSLLIVSNLTINITDRSNTLGIIRNIMVESKVPITGFEDPTYPLNTLGRGLNVIARSPHIDNYTQIVASGIGNGSYFYGTTIVLPRSANASIGAVTNKNTKVLVTDSVIGIESTANQFAAVVVEGSANTLSVTRIGNATNAMLTVPNNTKVLVDAPTSKVWHIENLHEDINKSYYHPSTKGGSFLDRLEGKINLQAKYSSQTSNIIGLESFVDKDFLALQGLNPNVTKTNVDYIYFSGLDFPAFSVKGIGGTFRIDLQTDLYGLTHAAVYNVSQILE